MTCNNALRGVLLASAMVPLLSQPVLAQVAASAQNQQSTVSDTQAANQPSYQPGGYVVLSDFVAPCHNTKHPENCGVPRAARPSTIAEDSPVMDHATYIRYYPQMGERGYQKTADSNKSLCDEGRQDFAGMQNLDMLFTSSDDEYKVLNDIYDHLPSEVKLHTRVMQGTQAIQAGLLCLLSAGLYCIAAVAGNVGNIFTAESNLDLQLDNIKLSIANIKVTRLNIWSNRLTLRLDGMWLKRFMPFCKMMGYDTPSGLSPTPPVPALSNGGSDSDDH